MQSPTGMRLSEFVRTIVATAREVKRCEGVAKSEPPALRPNPDPYRLNCISDEPSPAYIERLSLAATINERTIDVLRSGAWFVTGRVNTRPRQDLEFSDLVSHVLDWQRDAIGHYKHVLVRPAEPDTNYDILQPAENPASTNGNCHVGKAGLRADLREWFETMILNSHPPQPKPKWIADAKHHFEGQELTENLFNGVWADLGHPHPLKLDGRERSA